MKFFYNLFVHLFPFFIRVASIWNPKAALWVKGRKDQFERLRWAVGQSSKPIIWFHTASLGEFEQGRPVIEEVRMKYPGYRILLTFFSPSGYEIRKNYAGADMVFYLPMDTKRNANLFLEITVPQLAIFIKYETWYNFLSALKIKGVPSLLVSAVVYPHQFSFSPWASFMKKTLALFTHIFAQSDDALDMLKAHQIETNYSLGGDTRYDRVKTLSDTPFQHNGIEQFLNNQAVLVAGSTWYDDEKMLTTLMREQSRLKLVIAPHEISTKNISILKDLFQQSILFSELDKIKNPEYYSVLIIDNIGLLSKLYRYATIAYIGGGFNQAGIHNVLEAAVYGNIVLFGSNYSKSNEAKEMIELSLAYSFSTKDELTNIVASLFNNPEQLNQKNLIAKQFVEERTGATKKVLALIEKHQFLNF
jgi:3-deoxy-D-manno-octulosonic-acid transferase